MNAVALTSFGSRIGPWLGRMVSTDAKFLPSLFSRLKTAGASTGSSVASMVAWAKSSPSNAILLSTTLASLGFAVADLFGRDSKDPEVRDFMADLVNVAANANAAINKLGAGSELARTGGASQARQTEDETAIEVLSWARGFFGSVPNAVAAHRMLQVYTEMPLEEVQHGFSIYKLR